MHGFGARLRFGSSAAGTAFGVREADVVLLGSVMSLQLLAPAAAVIAALLLSACKPEETPPPPPRTARVIEAVPAPLLLAAEGSGTIASRTNTSVGFLVSGRLDTRDVDVGDTVTAGQTIAAIDPTDLKNQLDSAKTAVDAANASVAQTSAEEAAKRQLLKQGFTTQSEYNEALKALQTAQADLANAQANVRLAEDQLRYATLKSPVAGAVTVTGADPGQVIQAGQMIVTIADTAALDAVFSVPAQLANVARIGGVVTVWLQQDPNVKVTGKVRQIAPDADATTGTYTIKVALDNPPPEMRLGALVRGRAEQTGDEVISIPPTALVQTGDAAAGVDRLRRRLGPPQAGDGGALRHRRGADLRRHREGRPRGHRRRQFARRGPGRDGREGACPMTGNLSAWSIRHRVLILFFMILCLAGGGFAYVNLGREEDPSFAITTMVVSAGVAGSLAGRHHERGHQHDRGEARGDALYRRHQELHDARADGHLRPAPRFDAAVAIADAWYEVRKKVSDIEHELPDGIVGPFFNDEYGDVFGIVYGLTFDGYTWRQARDFAEAAKAAFLSASDTGKVEIYGDQDEKIYLTFSPEQLAAIGVRLDDVMNAIAAQNAVTPSGVITTPDEEILIDVSGELVDTDSLAAINLWIQDRFYNLTQLATISRVPVDPPTKMFQVSGRPSIGIGISMRAGGNNLTFGEEIARDRGAAPAGFPDRHRPGPCLRPARGGAGRHLRFHQRAVRGAGRSSSSSASSASGSAPGWWWRCRFRWCSRSSSSSSTRSTSACSASRSARW